MLLQKIKKLPVAYTIYRLYKAAAESFRYSKKVFKYAINSKETATFTYKLTEENEEYLINVTAQVTGVESSVVKNYFKELYENQQFQSEIIRHLKESPYRMKKDKRCDFGNKAALYAMTRIARPRVIVENGVEAGFTSAVFCEALFQNKKEGFPGEFIGLDISSDAGYLIKVKKEYADLSSMMYGDAINSLKQIEKSIDFYFSDGLRLYSYEKGEFEAIRHKLCDASIVVTNKALFSKALLEFAESSNRRFVFFKEQPLGHWYQGSGLGIMYK